MKHFRYTSFKDNNNQGKPIISCYHSRLEECRELVSQQQQQKGLFMNTYNCLIVTLNWCKSQWLLDTAPLGPVPFLCVRRKEWELEREDLRIGTTVGVG